MAEAQCSPQKSIEAVTAQLSQLTVLSFRKLDEVKQVTEHLEKIENHPATKQKAVLHNYIKFLKDAHKRIFYQKRDGLEVEYIFTTEKKSSMQRQRFNSLPVSEVPELLKTELPMSENARHVHICTDCDVEIELNEDEPLMESLQKHFNLEIHMPKMKRDSVDVAEPIILPSMSRRMSSMKAEGQSLEQILESMMSTSEKMDKGFVSKLEAALVKILPDNSENSLDGAMKFFQEAYDKLCQEVSNMDFTAQTSLVAPIIMSIKDNVNQSIATDTNKNIENEEFDAEKQSKSQPKKFRYYGPIENYIIKLLSDHKVITLTDDRTTKTAFFCVACEFYTLRFRYDAILLHLFNETHIHNLACILQSDKSVQFATEQRTMEKIKELNTNFFYCHRMVKNEERTHCGLCKSYINMSDEILHVLEDRHLAKFSDMLYNKAKAAAGDNDNSFADTWGSKSPDWNKHLANSWRTTNFKDRVIIENFIKQSGKGSNYCTCCGMNLKGPRHVLFNHVRQKKHLRNAAPKKLTVLYKNFCRPLEYYASFGSYFVCCLCPDFPPVPSIAAIIEHFEMKQHIDNIARLIRSALYPDSDKKILTSYHLDLEDVISCVQCDVQFSNNREAVLHILTDLEHQNCMVEKRGDKKDIISVYMNRDCILHKEGAVFECFECNGVFNSIRSLLMHLVYADHFPDKPSPENIFRFYLELKHNINMWSRNKCVYYDFGRMRCGVCEVELAPAENVKSHVLCQDHREKMGVSYVSLTDASNE